MWDFATYVCSLRETDTPAICYVYIYLMFNVLSAVLIRVFLSKKSFSSNGLLNFLTFNLEYKVI
jgi:hypothetical protein